MAAQPRTILVLYGSETGNAQDMAEELGKICQRLHFNSTVEEMDGVSLVRATALRAHVTEVHIELTGRLNSKPCCNMSW